MSFYKEKVNLALSQLNNLNIDLWIIFGDETAINSEPILDIISDHEFIGNTALLFFKNGKKIVIATPIDIDGYINTKFFDENISFPVDILKTLAEVISKYKPNSIALDFSEMDASSDGLTYGKYLKIKESLDSINYKGTIVSAQDITTKIRNVKSSDEIELITKACSVTLEIFEKAKDFIKVGVTALDIYNFFQNEVKERKLNYSWDKLMNPCVFVGPNTPIGHMAPPPIKVERGMLINVDFGIRLNNYASDMQRTYYVLDKGETDAPTDVKNAFNALRDTIKESANYLKPNKRCVDVDSHARKYLIDKGYPNWPTALGHTLGRYAHDGALLLGASKPNDKLRDLMINKEVEENNVFTLEPSIKLDGYGIIGIEEVVVVRNNKSEFLSKPQQELYLIKG
jgi:Xaa-Pro aminopeptidase